MNTNSDETTARSVPTLETLRDSLAKFDAAVDAQDTLAGAVWASVCTGQLQIIVDLLSSGAYALVSRADREKALNLAHDYSGAETFAEARSLLSLDAPKA